MARLVSRRVAVLLVAGLCVVGAAAPALAADDHRDRPSSNSPPVTVYVSEELDISDVRLTGGGQVGDDDRSTPRPVTFQRVDGPENFTVDDPEQANFTGVVPGSYDALKDDDTRPELTVVQPRVTRLTLRTRSGQNVTDDIVRQDRIDVLVVTAEYDFADVDRLQVTMTRDGESVGLNQRAARITESPGRYAIGFRDRMIGRYNVTVAGSAIEAGRRSATVEVVGADFTPTGTATATVTETATSSASPTSTPTPAPTPTPTPTATATAASSPTGTATGGTSPTAGAGPGPGLVSALAALLVASLVAIRRR